MSIPDGTIIVNAKELIKRAKHASWMAEKKRLAYLEDESRQNQCPDCEDKDIEIRVLNSILRNVTCGMCPHFETVRYRDPCGPNEGYCKLYRKLGTLNSDAASCSTKMPLVIMNPRNISYEDAEKEIREYVAKAGNRTVYISELAEELNIDMDLIAKIHDPRRVIPDTSDVEEF